jgi:WS/DGAT/MGAT family acyltransferase
MRFERRMSDADALMWAIEKDPLLRSTITAVSVLEHSPDRDRFMETIERATRLIPRLRQRVVSSPLQIAPPEYVVDPNFDLGYHVRFTGAPGSGTLRDLLDFAAPLAMQGFDRARPLWEFHVVEGLEGGRAAMIQKLHHSLTDGVGAMKISMSFLDTRRDSRREPEAMPELPLPERPSARDRIVGSTRHQLRRNIGIASRLPGEALTAARRPLTTARATFAGATSAARMMKPVSAPLSPIMTGRSLSVRFDTITASLPAMKAASKRVDGKLNDAFVAAVAGGLNRYHQRHGIPCDELRMTMPINVRAEGELVAGNEFAPARFAFPISIEDPLERMTALKQLVEVQRGEPALSLISPIAGVLNRMPVTASTALFGSMLKAIDVVTSNVPGAPIPVYVAGARLEANFGFGPLSGAASNITLLSYVDDLHIAVSTDRAAVRDPEVYLECMNEGFEEVQKLA